MLSTTRIQPFVAPIRQELVAITEDHILALILNQFIYWIPKMNDVNSYVQEERDQSGKNHGWIQKSAKQLSEEIMIKKSSSTMGEYLSDLIQLGYLLVKPIPGMNKYQYRVNLTCVIQAIEEKTNYLVDRYFELLMIENQVTNMIDSKSLEHKNQVASCSKIESSCSKIENHNQEITKEIKKTDKKDEMNDDSHQIHHQHQFDETLKSLTYINEYKEFASYVDLAPISYMTLSKKFKDSFGDLETIEIMRDIFFLKKQEYLTQELPFQIHNPIGFLIQCYEDGLTALRYVRNIKNPNQRLIELRKQFWKFNAITKRKRTLMA